MTNIAIHGALGRMGKRIYALAKEDANAKVVKLIDHAGHPDINTPVDGITPTSFHYDLGGVDAVIDFSIPEASMLMLDACVKAGTPIVIGTTGFTKEQIAKIYEAADSIPVVYTSNMSVSVNLFFKVLGDVARVLQNYAITMHEAHHVHKKDAPSGTAKTLVDIINEAGNYEIKYEDVAVTREGEIIGDHDVVFDGPFDRFEIRHHAKTRDFFAVGAVKAGVWVKGKAVGIHTMREVLGL
jgi:4-hydroxy-tetrahydrodipicolinate reductase